MNMMNSGWMFVRAARFEATERLRVPCVFASTVPDANIQCEKWLLDKPAVWSPLMLAYQHPRYRPCQLKDFKNSTSIRCLLRRFLKLPIESQSTLRY